MTGLDFNADGSQFVTFHRNGDVNLWNAADQTLIKTIATYSYGRHSVQFLPDDHSVLYRAGELRAGHARPRQGAITHAVRHAPGHLRPVHHQLRPVSGARRRPFAAGSDFAGWHWLAISTANDAVYLWDVVGGERVQLRDASEQVGQFSIRAFAFSRDSSQLIYFDGDDSKTHVWDVNDRTETLALRLRRGRLSALRRTRPNWRGRDRQPNAVYVADLAAGAEPVQVFALPDDLRVAPTDHHRRLHV